MMCDKAFLYYISRYIVIYLFICLSFSQSFSKTEMDIIHRYVPSM